jgi:thiol-disulfide isomerase/thioredoxin
MSCCTSKRRPRAVFFLPAMLALAGVAVAAEFRGRLDPRPEIGTGSYRKLEAAPADLIARLPAALPTGAKAWTPKGAMEIKGRRFDSVVVAAPDGTAALWLDRNRDGKFAADEQWPPAGNTSEILLTLPWEIGYIREFPLRVRLDRRDPFFNTTAADPNDRTFFASLSYNFNVIFGASVDLDGRALRLAFGPRPAEQAVDLLTARISMDANFNGRFEGQLGEVENASGARQVFRVGSRYLAVKSVDMVTGEVVVEERPASEYTRFDAQPGQEMPDFAFVDLAGGKHKLSDFRGKVVLLDFWGTWCGPCVAEMKLLDPLYAQYQPKGFEVIGMVMEKTSGRLTAAEYAADLAKVRAFIAKAGHRWIQATQESIERVAIDVIHVNSYPTCILIGRDGKVLSREARGQVLADLLAKHLP